MKIDMTPRDKKLLIFLSLFVIIVCFSYWGIYPQIKAMKKIDADIQTEQEKKEINEMKIVQLPMLEMDNKELEEKIKDARSKFYPMMKGDEIDKYFTSMVLGYNLQAYDLSINISEEPAKLEPYKYSNEYLMQQMEDDSAEYDDSSSTSTSSNIETVDSAANADENIETLDGEENATGIYPAQISMRLGGDEANIRRLIQDLSVSDQKILINSYAWSEKQNYDFDRDGEYTISYDRVLNLTATIYMCEE